MTRTPIWERLFRPGEGLRTAINIAMTGGPGELGGVMVDFRHPDLEPGEWYAPFDWHVWDSQVPRFPWLHSVFVFPFEQHIDDDALAKMILGPPSQCCPIRVFAGDRISVDRVVTVEIPGRDMFEHLHQRCFKNVLLKVSRADGTEEVARLPLQFHGSTNISDAPWLRASTGPTGLHGAIVYDALAGRIDRATADIAAQGDVVIGNPDYREKLYFDLGMTEDRLSSLLDSLDEILPANVVDLWESELPEAWKKNDPRVELVSLVSLAMQAGFCLARHEMKRAERPFEAVLENQKLAVLATTDQGAREIGRHKFAQVPMPSRTAVTREIAALRGTPNDEHVIRSLMRTLEVVDPRHKRFEGRG